MTTNGTTPKPRDIWQDAFFEEERAKGLTAGDTVNPATGAPYNRFDVPLVLSAWKTARTQPADPLHDPAIAITVEPGTPESFNVLVREMQSLCLDVIKLLRTENGVADIDEDDENPEG